MCSSDLKKQDFFTINTDSIRQTVENTTNTLKLLISGIAVISLVVGGIGVMNIMLVSVTERTREIGVRMAVGARQGNIMEQFLIEAVLLCLVGGVMGILFSRLVGWGLGMISDDFSMLYSSGITVVALACSSATASFSALSRPATRPGSTPSTPWRENSLCPLGRWAISNGRMLMVTE